MGGSRSRVTHGAAGPVWAASTAPGDDAPATGDPAGLASLPSLVPAEPGGLSPGRPQRARQPQPMQTPRFPGRGQSWAWARSPGKAPGGRSWPLSGRKGPGRAGVRVPSLWLPKVKPGGATGWGPGVLLTDMFEFAGEPGPSGVPGKAGPPGPKGNSPRSMESPGQDPSPPGGTERGGGTSWVPHGTIPNHI